MVFLFLSLPFSLLRNTLWLPISLRVNTKLHYRNQALHDPVLCLITFICFLSRRHSGLIGSFRLAMLTTSCLLLKICSSCFPPLFCALREEKYMDWPMCVLALWFKQQGSLPSNQKEEERGQSLYLLVGSLQAHYRLHLSFQEANPTKQSFLDTLLCLWIPATNLVSCPFRSNISNGDALFLALGTVFFPNDFLALYLCSLHKDS